MKAFIRMSLVLTLTLLSCFFVSCSKEAPMVDETPFRKPIKTYLKKNNFGMEIKSFKEIKVAEDGKSATAKCKMKAKDIPQNITVTWEFNFKKDDKDWTVTGHTKK